MANFYKSLFVLFFLSYYVIFPLTSENVLIRFSNEEQFFLDLSSKTTTQRVLHQVGEVNGVSDDQLFLMIDGRVLSPKETISPHEGQEFWVYFRAEDYEDVELVPKKTHIGYRKYHVEVSKDEKKDIHYILKTLAQKSLTSIWGYKSQLEYAGDRIDHLHPLKFLECVFTDEELKVYIHNIKKRGGWIWSEFINGFHESLQEETEIGNLKEEFIHNFVQRIGVDLNLIHPIIHAQKWEEFVKTLILHVPRKGDSGRYDQ